MPDEAMMGWIVAANFEGNVLCCGGIIAPSPELAGAGAVTRFVREGGIKGELTGMVLTPLHVDFCRAVVRAAEGERQLGAVLSLASSRGADAEPATEPDPPLVA